MSQHLDLRQVLHTACRDRSREEREATDTDGLCTNIVAVLDGLRLRSVGEWAYDKIYRLVQYFGIFAGGMKKQWAALNYIEIGSGPGRCIIRETCTELDGTALAIVRNGRFSAIQKAIFVDASTRVTSILNERIAALGGTSIARAVVGDYENGAGPEWR